MILVSFLLKPFDLQHIYGFGVEKGMSGIYVHKPLFVHLFIYAGLHYLLGVEALPFFLPF